MTDNVQVIVTSELISVTDNSHLYTPPMKYRTEGAAVQPKISIGPGGLSACAFSGGYAHLSVLRWSKNPHGQSESVRSPLLRLALDPHHGTESLQNPFSVDKDGISRRKELSSSNKTVPNSASFNLSGIPAYSVTLQFSRKIEFNFSATADLSLKSSRGRALNYTLPACTVYNGVKYVPCKGCNISTFTNYNVTYACYDVHQLCPQPSTPMKMAMQSHLLDTVREENRASEGEIMEREGEGEDVWSRDLSVADHGSQASTYGVLLESIIEELSSVLSNNPFALNLTANKTILCFVSLLGGFIVAMLLYLLRVDYDESVERRYMGEECEAAVRDQVAEDIKSGGKGDLGATFQQYSRQYRDERRASSSVMGSIKRIKRRGTLFDKEGSSTKSVTVNCMHLDKDGHSPVGVNGKRITVPDSIQEGDEEEDGEEEDDGNEVSSENGNHNNNNEEHDINEEDRTIATRAALTGFLHNLFPGRSIFPGNRNVLQVISVYHDYFRMFAGSELTKTRTIRFLSVVCVVLPTIFTDTVFFGIYFPAVSLCQTYTDEVSFNFS